MASLNFEWLFRDKNEFCPTVRNLSHILPPAKNPMANMYDTGNTLGRIYFHVPIRMDVFKIENVNYL